MRFVITHKEMGVYLGCCMGFGFWTLLDPIGQPEAVTFESREAAEDIMETWDELPEGVYTFVPVTPNKYATIAELRAAGLDHLLGDMEADALKYADPVGSA